MIRACDLRWTMAGSTICSRRRVRSSKFAFTAIVILLPLASSCDSSCFELAWVNREPTLISLKGPSTSNFGQFERRFDIAFERTCRRGRRARTVGRPNKMARFA